MELTIEQSNAIDYLTTNLGKGILALDGPAGSGKTTIMKDLVTQLTTAGYTPVVTASTNKAASSSFEMNAISTKQAGASV